MIVRPGSGAAMAPMTAAAAGSAHSPMRTTRGEDWPSMVSPSRTRASTAVAPSPAASAPRAVPWP